MFSYMPKYTKLGVSSLGKTGFRVVRCHDNYEEKKRVHKKVADEL